MNSGSISNPSTREARLFAFLQDHVGVRFTSNDLDAALNPGGHSPCAHSYLASLRIQLDACPALGFVLPLSVFDKTKGNQNPAFGRVGAYVYWLERRVDVEIPKKPRPRPAKRVVRSAVRTERYVHAAGQMEFAGVGG